MQRRNLPTLNARYWVAILIASLLGACMGVVAARIISEFVLIVFRINEHLGAIRNQGSGVATQ